LKISWLTALLIASWLCSVVQAAEPRTWVLFRDRGYSSPQELREALHHETDLLLPATRQRLLKVRSANALLNEADLPIYMPYLKEIERLTGQNPHALCRAINGASFALDQEQIGLVQSLPFVLGVKPVLTFRDSDNRSEPPAPEPDTRILMDSLFYGSSYLQNAIENFPPAHEAGYTGEGVLVGMLDAGWNNLGHVCFDSLEIIATWDFVNGDSSVANDPGQMGEGSHGTKTLSCLAGYDRQNLIGTAYGISVALAKTENTGYELLIEEDNWAAGIEWLDSLGCAVVSSSVSYRWFDNGDTIFYWMRNGNTTIITNAADNAVARGIVVLNSVSNHGTDAYPYNKMNVPADGDSVLGIGAVNSDSTRASSSSIGPTYDGRIKPDLMALGVSVKVASPYDSLNYLFGGGTSFSTPITAGACALLLQADPALTPMQIHAFLKASATQALNPDTLNGWGIYDVWQAIQAALSAAPGSSGSASLPSQFRIVSIHPNPFNGATRISFDLPNPETIALWIYDLSGRSLGAIAQGPFAAGRHEVIWNYLPASSGIYIVHLQSPQYSHSQKVIYLK
jgi:hypothetical protein